MVASSSSLRPSPASDGGNGAAFQSTILVDSDVAAQSRKFYLSNSVVNLDKLTKDLLILTLRRSLDGMYLLYLNT